MSDATLMKRARFSKQLQEIMCSTCSIPGNCNGCSFYGEENEFYDDERKGGERTTHYHKGIVASETEPHEQSIKELWEE